MTVLGAIFLWALPLVAAPVVIHLLHRRQQRVIRWGAMQFLVDSVRRRRRLWRPDDWLLMLLRCAALLALVLALARPLVRAAWLGVGPQRDVILVLDVSMSMGRVAGDASPFDRLKTQVDEVLDRVSAAESLQVVLAAATPLWQTTDAVTKGSTEFENLHARLRALEPSLGPADLLAAIEQALATEPNPDAQSRLIAVITDGRAQGLPPDAGITAARLQQQLQAAAVPTVINVVDVGGDAATPRNLAVDRVESDRVLAGVGEPVVLRAQVSNYGAEGVGSTELRWSLGDEILNTSFTDVLRPGQSTTVAIEHAFDAPGLRVLTCRAAGRDDLPADDEARLIVEVRDRVPILVVASSDVVESAGEEAKYVLAALGRGERTQAAATSTFFEPTLIEADDLEQTTLTPYYAIVLTDVPSLSESVVKQLVEFVDRGGGLWLALGGDTEGAEFNRLAVENNLSPVMTAQTVGNADKEQDFTALHPPSPGHPATGLLGDTARLDIQDARILRRWQLLPRQPELKLSVLLETSRGEPVAVEHFVGRGRVIVQAFPLTRSWSNLTLCKLYVPYVQEWLRYLVQPAIPAHNLAINEPLLWRQPGGTGAAEATLSMPMRAPIQVSSDVDRDGPVYRQFDTVFPGDYELMLPASTSAEALTIPFVVQREPAESDLRAWSNDLEAAFAAVPELRFTANALAWPENIATKPATAPAWSWLLWGLVALMGIELAALCWFAWRKQTIRRLPAPVQ